MQKIEVPIHEEGGIPMQDHQISSHQSSPKSALNKRLEDIGWGLFLIMMGGLLLVPNHLLPQGTWLIGIGLIMLGINGVRYLNHIKVSSFSLVFGVFALAAGLGDLFSLKLPLFAIFLVFIGVSLTLKALIEKRN